MLCTLDEVRSFLGLQSSNAHVDDLLSNLINYFTTAFETYCDRKFSSTTFTEYYDGKGTDTLFTNHYPIISIDSIYESSSQDWTSTNLIPSGDYIIVDDNSIVLDDDRFDLGKTNIKITYTAGYGTIPNDLKLACIMEVVRLYQQSGRIGVNSVTDPAGGTTNYVNTPFTPTTTEVLKRYKNRIIP